VRALLLAVALLAAAGGSAAAVQPVRLVDAGGAAVEVSADDLRALPGATLQVVFATRDGAERGVWTGALLWALIGRAAPPAEGRLLRTVVVTGRDGYAVALSLGELDPEFGGEPSLLAWSRDGEDLPAQGGPRLVVPGDKRGSRAVRDVVRVEIR